VAKEKILLVDDVPLLLELEKSFLYFSPVRVITARNGEEALTIARKERPRLIYMDLHMPKMDGAVCCARIKADPELRAIPVVMITSDCGAEAKARCRDAGCDGFLVKPMTRREFLEMGHQFLPGIERREVRVPCRIPLNIHWHGADSVAVSADISAGGLFVAIDANVSEEEWVNITFSMPDDSSATISAQGRVAWKNSGVMRRKPLLPPGFGVEFVTIDEQAVEAIQRYVGKVKPR
jgi:CheY-like chemotaxis protein